MDVRLELAPGEARVVRLSAVEWVEVDAPHTVAAEVLPGGQELLLEARADGEALLLLYAQGRFAVWRLVVGAPRSTTAETETRYGAALGACPGLNAGAEDAAGASGRSESGASGRSGSLGGREGRRDAAQADTMGKAAAARVALPPAGSARVLKGRVQSEACRAALHTLLESEAFLARELELTFELELLQAQLKRMDAAWTKARLPVAGRYEGAGLVLAGEVTAEQHRRALWEAFRHSVGKVSLEDRMVVLPSPSEPPVPEGEALPPVPRKTPGR